MTSKTARDRSFQAQGADQVVGRQFPFDAATSLNTSASRNGRHGTNTDNEGTIMNNWVLLFIAGLIALIGGVIALLNPLAATITAVVLTGWVLVIAGVIEVIGVFSANGWGARLWTLILGVLTIILGLYILANPLISAVVLTWLVGVLFLATGVTKIVLSFGMRGTGYFRVVMLSGIVSVVLGVMVISNFPYSAASILGVLLAVELISSGVANIALSLRLRETGPVKA
jgi:uncharacterized membrane protein HdeD (DUF308 family)